VETELVSAGKKPGSARNLAVYLTNLQVPFADTIVLIPTDLTPHSPMMKPHVTIAVRILLTQ